MKERFADLRRMGLRTVMITGDNPVTAAAIASEAGVDDFLAEATPEDKLRLIREEQAKGRLVAMCGDGSNDAPALAQADVGVAMQTGTQAAREAGNMVDLDSDPTKVIEIVEVGKQMLITRGALTTFSIANDVAKYFAIIPAIFVVSLPALGALNIMRPEEPAQRHPVGDHLQRPDHHRPGAAGAARRALPADRRRQAAAAQPPDLRPGRHRRAVHRHQDRRPDHHLHRPGLGRLRTPCSPTSAPPSSRRCCSRCCSGSAIRWRSPASPQVAFPYQANGSLVRDTAGHVIGSALLAQPFAKDEYLHPRPSAAGIERLRSDQLRRLQLRAA